MQMDYREFNRIAHRGMLLDGLYENEYSYFSPNDKDGIRYAIQKLASGNRIFDYFIQSFVDIKEFGFFYDVKSKEKTPKLIAASFPSFDFDQVLGPVRPITFNADIGDFSMQAFIKEELDTIDVIDYTTVRALEQHNKSVNTKYACCCIVRMGEKDENVWRSLAVANIKNPRNIVLDIKF